MHVYLVKAGHLPYPKADGLHSERHTLHQSLSLLEMHRTEEIWMGEKRQILRSEYVWLENYTVNLVYHSGPHDRPTISIDKKW